MNKCLGCGIELQTEEKEKLGYIVNLDNKICNRCFKLKNYGEYTNVTLNNKDYQQIISQINPQNLVVYIVDILNLNPITFPDFSNMILVLTKRDILPKSIKDEKIIMNLKQNYKKFLDIICVSSIKNYNIDKLYQTIKKHAHQKEVYLIGNTNSGKSTLLNTLIKNYDEENHDPIITTSMYPSTTLDKVKIKLGNLQLIDTPGLIEEGNIINNLTAKELKSITPKKEIKPKTCQITNSGSILIGSYVRVDYQTNTTNSFVIYTANTIQTNFISKTNLILKDKETLKLSLAKNKDIVIKGLGFIKFTKEINLTIYLLPGTEIFIRDNLI